MSEEEHLYNERDSLEKSREDENKSLLNENNVKNLPNEDKKDIKIENEIKIEEKEEEYQSIVNLPSIESLSSIKIPKSFHVFKEDLNNSQFVQNNDENFPDPEDFDQKIEEDYLNARRKSEEFKRYLKEKYLTDEPYLYSDIQNTKESDELLIEEDTENERVWKCCSIKCSLQ